MRIKIDVQASTIANMFVSFIESGDPVTHGWCRGVYYHSKKAKPPKVLTIKGEDVAVGDRNWYEFEGIYDDPSLMLEVHEYDEETGKIVKLHQVLRRHLIKGLVIMAKKFPRQFSQIIGDNTDAPCADLFVQCVLFGEEKYA